MVIENRIKETKSDYLESKSENKENNLQIIKK